MIVKCYKENFYVPKWNANRMLDVSDQIKVHHRYLTPDEREKYFYTKPLKITPETEGYEIEVIEDKPGCCKAIVTKIENYTIDLDGDMVEVNTVSKLYKTPGVDPLLVKEIEEAMVKASPVIDEKALK